MFSQNPRIDTFNLYIPDTFFIDTITKKYDQFLRQKPFVLKSIKDILFESIQSFDTPEFGYNVITQNTIDKDNAGFQIGQIPKESFQKLTEKTFSITFRHTDAYITYFLMMEHFFERYKMGSNQNRKDFGTIILETLTPSGVPMCRIKYNECFLVGIPPLTLSYATPSRDFSSFTCTFSYNSFATSLEVPDLKLTSV